MILMRFLIELSGIIRLEVRALITSSAQVLNWFMLEDFTRFPTEIIT